MAILSEEPYLLILQRSRFPLGRVVITPGIQALDNEEYLLECLRRHSCGDWGFAPDEDREMNDQHAESCTRTVHSSYSIDVDKPCAGHGDNCIWIITNFYEGATTILLPWEY